MALGSCDMNTRVESLIIYKAIGHLCDDIKEWYDIME